MSAPIRSVTHAPGPGPWRGERAAAAAGRGQGSDGGAVTTLSSNSSSSSSGRSFLATAELGSGNDPLRPDGSGSRLVLVPELPAAAHALDLISVAMNFFPYMLSLCKGSRSLCSLAPPQRRSHGEASSARETAWRHTAAALNISCPVGCSQDWESFNTCVRVGAESL